MGRRPGHARSRRRTRRWAAPPRSTAASRSAAAGRSRPAATTPSGSSSAAWSWATDGTPVDFRTFLLPRADYEIEDVWDTIGLRGTGSNDIIVKDAFVPEYRTLTLHGHRPLLRARARPSTPAPLYKLPFASVFSCSISSPGARHGPGRLRGLRRLDEGAGARLHRRQGGRRLVQPAAHRRGGRRSIDGAVLQIERNLEEELDHATEGEKIPMPLRVRVRRDQVNATGAGIAAVDRLFESAGGRALRTGTPIQRFWRDAHAGRVHAINDPEKALRHVRPVRARPQGAGRLAVTAARLAQHRPSTSSPSWPSGLRLHYHEAGDPAAETVVLLHGGGPGRVGVVELRPDAGRAGRALPRARRRPARLRPVDQADRVRQAVLHLQRRRAGRTARPARHRARALRRQLARRRHVGAARARTIRTRPAGSS